MEDRIKLRTTKPGRSNSRCKAIHEEIADHVLEAGKNMSAQQAISPSGVDSSTVHFMIEAGRALKQLAGTELTVGMIENNFDQLEGVSGFIGIIYSMDFDELFNLCFSMVFRKISIADACNRLVLVRR